MSHSRDDDLYDQLFDLNVGTVDVEVSFEMTLPGRGVDVLVDCKGEYGWDENVGWSGIDDHAFKVFVQGDGDRNITDELSDADRQAVSDRVWSELNHKGRMARAKL